MSDGTFVVGLVDLGLFDDALYDSCTTHHLTNKTYPFSVLIGTLQIPYLRVKLL